MIRAVHLILALSLFILLIPAADTNSAENQQVSVIAKVDKTSVRIGDKIIYTIEAKAPKGFEVQLPSFGENLADFSVKNFSSDEGGLFSRTYTQTYTLDIYETGTFSIPAALVKYRQNSNSEWKEKLTPAIAITVESLMSSNGEPPVIKDIKGPRSINNYQYLYVLLAVLLAIVVASVIFIYLRKRKQTLSAEEPLPPAHERALKALRELMSKDYINKGKIQEYYFELSSIVRHYLEDRFFLKAPEMTTEEFLLHLKDTDKLSQDQKSLLRDFLSQSDLVKFAQHLPAESEVVSSYTSAESLIEQTREVQASEEDKL